MEEALVGGPLRGVVAANRLIDEEAMQWVRLVNEKDGL